MSENYPVVPAGSIVFLPEGAKILDDTGRMRRIKSEYSFVTAFDSGAWSEHIFWAGARGMRNRVKKSACRAFVAAQEKPQ